MKVILKEDIKGLGKKEDMVEVSAGYARNYLLPRGLAVEANSDNINIMNTKKAAEVKKKEREFERAKALAEKLEGKTVVIKAKAGDNGRLFGSITNKDISETLKSNLKVDIDKKKINLTDTIKSLGSTEVEVKIYPNVSAKIIVKIESE
ncbi:MAG: 50S ribosomal protein L9 [Acetivibrionales bacterium]|jgi:large subunit ribosomal protein L9